MRKIKYILIFILYQSTFIANAQVENYALRLTSEAAVDFKYIPELNNLSEYTIQFWFNPDRWNKHATLFTRDRGASLWAMRLADEGTLEYCVGNEIISISDEQIGIGQWAQLTLSYDGVRLSVSVNNKEKSIKASGNYTIPYSEAYFKVGGGYEGRIDEIRLYSKNVDPEYVLWQNTLNHLHPNWDDLIAYWKMDQSCDNIADYKLKHNGERQGQVTRGLVTDNASFKYKVISAYTGFSRFFDRSFDTHKILLTNDLLLLVCNSSADGSVSIAAPDNSGVLTNCNYLPEFKDKQGVLSFNGAGSKMDVGKKAFNPSETYTFESWVYIDEWIKDAYLFRKEPTVNQGFSIRFGEEENHELIARVNGNEFKIKDKLEVGKWIHMTVSGVNHTMTGAKYVVQFGFDGIMTWATSFPTTKVSYKMPDLNKISAVIGENFKGKLEQTTIWHVTKSTYDKNSRQSGVPLPDFQKKIGETLPYDCNSYWKFDDTDRPGFDSYSHTCFKEILSAPYKNHRGFKIRLGILGHAEWKRDFASQEYREKLAKAIAELPDLGYDGVELDFEWCYGDYNCNSNYGKLLQEIRKHWNPEKTFTVSPHDVSYSFPKNDIQYADYYSFQNYGPSASLFKKEAILDRAKKYQDAGYPKTKICISFSPMTSAPHDEKGNRLPGVESALWFFHNEYTDPNLDYHKSGDSYYWFTGVNHARWRCQYVVDNDLHGAMYWDIGGDNPDTTHPLSVVRSASFAINSNVDTIIANAPIATFIPERLADKKQLQVYVSSDKKHIVTVLPENVNAETLELIDFAGIIISQQKIQEKRISTPTKGLSKGVYFVRVRSKDDTFVQKVFIC